MNLYPPGVLFADAVSSFSDTFVLLCFRFRFFAFTEAAALGSIVLCSSICMRPLQPHLFFPVFHFFVSLDMSLFPSILYHYCRLILLIV